MTRVDAEAEIAECLAELIQRRVVKVDGDQIIIEFLDRQIGEAIEVSNIARKNALKRWHKKASMRSDAGASNGNANKNENREESEKNESVIFPFESEAFKQLWEIWKRYKWEQFKFKFRSIISEQGALKKLSKYSEEVAVWAIEETIAAGWQGLQHKLKDYDTTGQFKPTSKGADYLSRYTAE